MSGIEDKEVQEQVQETGKEKYSDRMYQYYTGIADSGKSDVNTCDIPRMCRKSERYT